MISYIRTAANEFKTLYNAGDDMAELAYRQMNYYRDSDTNKLMGDFFLDIPSDDALVTVMMEGNTFVVTNLITLLAIGISGGSGTTLAERIAEKYAVKDTLTDTNYYDKASALADQFKQYALSIKRYDALSAEYDLTDEEMTEEEFEFFYSCAGIVGMLLQIPYGDETLKDFVARDTWTIQDLYPIVAALTEGQMALTEMGVFTTVLQYNSPSASIEELYAIVEETEELITDENGNLKIYEVYMGVDRSIFSGNFAFTNAAEREQAITGEEMSLGDYLNSAEADAAVPQDLVISLITSGGVISCGTAILTKVSVKTLSAMVTKYGSFQASKSILWPLTQFLTGGAPKIFTAGASKYLMAAGVGLVIAAIGVTVISVFYNYYNPDYTPIPDAMVDVRETDLGDKYVKYTAAKVYGDSNGRNADLNAYQGKEWNALYYTKDASAGKCLTPKFVYSDNDSSIARRHQGVSMFGENVAYNLNSHVFNGSAPAVYLTVRYSTAKKAAADVPKVVGSMVATGALYTLTALAGAGVGTSAMVLMQRAKKKEEDLPTDAN